MEFLISQYYNPYFDSCGHGSVYLVEIDRLNLSSGLKLSCGLNKNNIWGDDANKEKFKKEDLLLFKIINPVAKYTDGISSKYPLSISGLIKFLEEKYLFLSHVNKYKEIEVEPTNKTPTIRGNFDSKGRRPKFFKNFNKYEVEFFDEMKQEIMTILLKTVTENGLLFSANSYEDAIAIFKDTMKKHKEFIFGMITSNRYCHGLKIKGDCSLLSSYYYLREHSYDSYYIIYNKNRKGRYVDLSDERLEYGAFIFNAKGFKNRKYFDKPKFVKFLDVPSLFLVSRAYYNDNRDYEILLDKFWNCLLYSRHNFQEVDQLFSTLKEINPELEEAVLEVGNFESSELRPYQELPAPYIYSPDGRLKVDNYLTVDKSVCSVKQMPIAQSLTNLLIYRFKKEKSDRYVSKKGKKFASLFVTTAMEESMNYFTIAQNISNPKKEITKNMLVDLYYHGPRYIHHLVLPNNITLKEFLLNCNYKIVPTNKFERNIKLFELWDCLSDTYIIKTIDGEEGSSIKEVSQMIDKYYEDGGE